MDEREIPPLRTDRLKIRNLQVIFKVVERCNINCSYCYYFNMGEESSKARPALVSLSVAADLAKFIADGCRDLGIGKVHIGFHGGEPMMLKPRNFDRVCELLHDAISPVAEIIFAIQTNGTILSDEWLALFEKYRVNVGVSIDGDQAVHDRFRLDHAGKSTFDKTVSNLRALVDWADVLGRPRPSTISVMSAQADYRSQYRFLRSLGVRNMSFLLPDRSYDSVECEGQAGEANEFGSRLNELFDAWFEEDNLDVKVRQVDNVMQHFQAARPRDAAVEESIDGEGIEKRDYQIIVAQSDGSVTVDDCYIPALDWYTKIRAPLASETTLARFLNQQEFVEIDALTATAPEKCQKCDWLGVCGSGDLAHRYSRETGFNNPSPYCDAYLRNFTHIAGRLVADGYPEGEFRMKLLQSLPHASYPVRPEVEGRP